MGARKEDRDMSKIDQSRSLKKGRKEEEKMIEEAVVQQITKTEG